jgi:hypothetical protein
VKPRRSERADVAACRSNDGIRTVGDTNGGHRAALPRSTRSKTRTFKYEGVLNPAIGGSLFIPASSTSLVTLAVAVNGVAQEPATQLAIPQAIWELAGQHSQSRGDVFTLELTERANERIYGPIVSHVTIAPATVKGSIYYNSCVSATAGGGDFLGLGGKVLRIPPGGNAEVLSTDAQCVGCHSVSANGARIVAQRSEGAADVPGLVTNPGVSPITSVSHQLGIDGKPEPRRCSRARWHAARSAT